jgi:hypothetical protein
MSGCWGSIDTPLEAVFYQIGKITAVVNMGMGEDQCLHLVSRKGQSPIAFIRLSSSSLKQSAIQH